MVGKYSIYELNIFLFFLKPPSSPWVTPACSLTITHRNRFLQVFHHDSYDHNRSLFVSACNNCKCVLKEAKALFTDRMRHLVASNKFDSCDYWRFCNVIRVTLLSFLFSLKLKEKKNNFSKNQYIPHIPFAKLIFLLLL